MTIYPGAKPENLSQNSYPARKPYLVLEDSPVSFFTAPVRFLKESVTKESAFEKPYLDTEYPTMHLNLPYPDWPSGGIPKTGSISGRKSKLITGSNCEYCIIVCYGDQADSDCPEIYGWCHISIACTSAPQLGAANPGDVGWSVEGPVLAVTEDSMDGINIYADWDQLVADDAGIKTAAFLVTLTDGLGHKCTDEFELSCKTCQDPDCTISGPTTATQPGSAQYSIADEGGCKVDWSVSGSGVSIDDNGLVTIASGACGTFTVSASISDKCSDSKVVRVTNNGKWHYYDCPNNIGDNTNMYDAYCYNYSSGPWEVCKNVRSSACEFGYRTDYATKIDAETGYGYMDYHIYCFNTTKPDCEVTTACRYTDFDKNCGDFTQSAIASIKYTWECS